MKAPHIAYNDEDKVIDAMLQAVVDVPDDNYNQGMENIAIAFLYKQKAKERGCAFIDPHYVNGNLATLHKELREQPTQTVMTAPINVYADNVWISDNPKHDRMYRDLFQNTVAALQRIPHSPDTVIMPIGCQENGAVPHNILVILEDFNSSSPKASIIDQMGIDFYRDTKIKISDTLGYLGINNQETNEYPISRNRNDCATFTSYMADLPFYGENMQNVIRRCDAHVQTTGTYPVTTATIDMQHREDKEYLIKAVNSFGKEQHAERTASNQTPNRPIRFDPRSYS